jgi:hypothetical protein
VFDGYYEGATEEGDEVLLLIPSHSPVIANFRAKLSFLVIVPLQDDFDDTMTFEAKDLPIDKDRTFSYSGGDGALLFGLNGVLLPNGQARGTCIGTRNGGWSRAGVNYLTYGSSGWRKWQAVRNDEEEVTAESFLWSDP